MPMPAIRLPVLKYAYKAREGKDLEKLLEKELRGGSRGHSVASTTLTLPLYV